MAGLADRTWWGDLRGRHALKLLLEALLPDIKNGLPSFGRVNERQRKRTKNRKSVAPFLGNITPFNSPSETKFQGTEKILPAG